MNIDKTIAELELKHLMESLLELDIKDRKALTYGMVAYGNDLDIKDWSDKNIGSFIELLSCLGINDPSFCCIPLWVKLSWTMPVDTVHCFKLKDGKTLLSELKIDKKEEFTVLKRIDDPFFTAYPNAFFKMLKIALSENLMLNRPKILEQHPFMKKILTMFNNG